mgnify:CR=1 FL=1
MEKEKDIIRLTDTPLVCENCGKDIKPDSLVNEYCGDEDGGIIFYCMECVPNLVSEGAVWTREDVE